jgi:hypothetical protein
VVTWDKEHEDFQTCYPIENSDYSVKKISLIKSRILTALYHHPYSGTYVVRVYLGTLELPFQEAQRLFLQSMSISHFWYFYLADYKGISKDATYFLT